jgi:hypothetical protein
MNAYSGNSKVELTPKGWLYLAEIDIVNAKQSIDPRETVMLCKQAEQKLAAARSVALRRIEKVG